MAFLDPKTRIMDIMLTERGRKLLSQGNLKVKYYSFGDDEVDYQNTFTPYGSATVEVISPFTFDFGSGTFLRATSATYFTGSEVKVRHANSNVLRYSDIGDGNGAIALFERETFNPYRNNRTLQWSVISPAGMMTASSFTGTDDSLLVPRVNWRGGASDQFYDSPGGTALSGGTWFYSVFLQTLGATADDANHLAYTNTFGDGTPATLILTASVSGSWTRLGFLHTRTTAREAGTIIRNFGGTTHSTAYDFFQIETGTFPTSPIVVTGAVVLGTTRSVDVLYMPPATLQGQFMTGNWKMEFYPLGTSSEFARDTGYPFRTLLHFNEQNKLYFSRSNLIMMLSGVQCLNISSTWNARNQKLWAEVDLSGGTVFLSGFNTGNGVNFINTSSFPGGLDLYVGVSTGSRDSFCGRIKQPVGTYTSSVTWTPLSLGSKLKGWWLKTNITGSTTDAPTAMVDINGDRYVDILVNQVAGASSNSNLSGALITRFMLTSTLRNSLNGRQVIFNTSSVGRGQSVSNISQIYASTASGGVAFAFNILTSTTNTAISYNNDGGAGDDSQYQGVSFRGGSQAGVYLYAFDSVEKSLFFSATWPQTVVGFYQWRADLSQLRGAVNDSSVQTTSFDPSGIGFIGGKFLVGDTGISKCFSGSCGEVIAFTSLTNTEETNLMNYLNARWRA